MVDAGDHDAVARLEGVRPIIEYQFHAARKDDVEVEGVGVVHREIDVPAVIDDEPAGKSWAPTLRSKVGACPIAEPMAGFAR